MNDVNPVTHDVYHVFLASPGDVNKEREVVRNFFSEFNRLTSNPRRVEFKIIDWENYSTTGVGRPQALITKQVLEGYKKSLIIFIGILGERFGTPTGTYGSGTEEEFAWAIAEWQLRQCPEIKLFCKNVDSLSVPADVTKAEEKINQWRKVAEFKQKISSSGNGLLYKTFDDVTAFEKQLRNDLNIWFNGTDRPWAGREPNHSGIDQFEIGVGKKDGIPKTATLTRPVYQRHPPLGREDDKSACLKVLEDNRILLLHGPPGQGKTALARFVALSSVDIYADGVFEVDLQNEKQLDNVGKQIGLALGDTEFTDYRTLFEGKKALIILDSFEQLLRNNERERLSVFFDQIFDALSGSSRILITSRDRFEKAEIIAKEVKQLAPGFAIELFHIESHNLYSEEPCEQIREFVADELAGHPLSIKMVARYGYYASRANLSTLKRLWSEKWSAIGKFTPALDDKPLTTAFELSYSSLEATTKMMFLILGLLPDGIHTDLIQSVWGNDETEVYKALNELEQRSLIEVEGRARKLLSPIFRYAQDKLNEVRDDEIYLELIVFEKRIDLYYDDFIQTNAPQRTDDDPRRKNGLVRSEFHNIHASLDRRLEPSISDDNLRAAESVLRLYWAYHNNLSGYQNAISSAEDAVHYLEKAAAIFKVNDASEKAIECRFYIGSILWLRGDLERARPALKEAHESGSSSPEIQSECRRAFAHIEYKVGDIANAVRLYEETASQAEDTGDHECVIRCRIGLIDAYRKMGDLESAESCFMSLRNRMNDMHPSMKGNLIRGFAYIRLLQGNVDEAERLYRDALDTFKTVSPFGLAHCRRGLGEVFVLRKQFAEASSEFDQAIRSYDEARKNPSLGVGLVILGRGRLAREQGNESEALRLFREAERLFDPQSLNEKFEQAVSYEEIGNSLSAMGKDDDAVGNFRLAHKLFDQTGCKRAAVRVAEKIGTLGYQ